MQMKTEYRFVVHHNYNIQQSSTKPEELKDCGIFSRDWTETMKAIGPNPHDVRLFSCSGWQQENVFVSKSGRKALSKMIKHIYFIYKLPKLCSG